MFLLAGQSNAVGPGDSLESTVCHPNTAFEFDATANDLIPLKDPAGKPWKLFQQAGSMAPAFAKQINELTGQPLYMVTAARGGASCHRKAEMGNYDTWDLSGNLFPMAVEKTKMAEAKAGLRLSGIIWMQGERDANAAVAKKLKGVFIAYAETGEFARRKWFKDNVHHNREALNDIGTKTAEFVYSKSKK